MVMVEAQVNVAYAVVGDIRRLNRAVLLRDELGARLSLDMDEDSNANHDAAWNMYNASDDWLVVVEDDVELVPNFKKHVVDAIDNMPDLGVLSLYAGYPRPERFAVSSAVLKARQSGASYLKHNKVLWGPAVAMRTDMIDDMLNWVSGSNWPYDERFSQWMTSRRISAYYTMPSLVDHTDVESLLGRGGVPRKAYWFGEPTEWNSDVITI